MPKTPQQKPLSFKFGKSWALFLFPESNCVVKVKDLWKVEIGSEKAFC